MTVDESISNPQNKEQALEDLLAPMVVACQSYEEAKTLLRIYAPFHKSQERPDEILTVIKHLMINTMFHRVWTKSVGQPEYDKAEWESLRRLIYEEGGIAL